MADVKKYDAAIKVLRAQVEYHTNARDVYKTKSMKGLMEKINLELLASIKFLEEHNI